MGKRDGRDRGEVKGVEDVDGLEGREHGEHGGRVDARRNMG